MSPSPGSSTQRSVFLSTPAFLRRFVMLLLASVLLLFLAGSALASIGAPRPMLADTFSSQAWDPAELPDVAILVSDLEPADTAIERLVIPALRDLPGVSAVTAEQVSTDQIALHLSLGADAPEGVVDAIASVVGSSLPDAHVSLGGRVVADADVLDRLNRATIISVVPVIVLFAVLASAAFGATIGSAAGGATALATLLGGLVGSQVAGRFDGSIATTAVPAVLVSVLVSSALSLRLLDWFKNPVGQDQADVIGNSIKHLLPEVALLFSGLTLTALIVEVFGSGRASVTVVTAAGIVAAVTTLAVLPALLSTWEKVPTKSTGVFSSSLPDGRDFPVAVLGGFACFLLALGLFAVRVPNGDLLDESALAPGVSSRRVSEQLLVLGGDPTSAILAELPTDLSKAELRTWSASVSALGMVGWVQTSVGRFADGEIVGETDAALFERDEMVLAIVTPAVTGRSEAARTLVAQLSASGGSAFDVQLSGEPVRSAEVADTAALRLWLLVGLLSLSGGLMAAVLVRDLVMAVGVAALRFLGLGAALGVCHVIAGDVDSGELQVIALLLSVGIGLFELGLVGRIVEGLRQGSQEELSVLDRSALITNALHREGRAAIFGMGLVALCGIGYLASDLTVARRLGVSVAMVFLVDLVIGTWLLRPVLVGQRMVGAEAIESPEFRFGSGVSLPRLPSRRLKVPATSLDMLLALGDSDQPNSEAASAESLLVAVDQAEGAKTDQADSTDQPAQSGVGVQERSSRAQWREMLPIGRPLSETFAATEDSSPQWRRIVGGLLRDEFSFQLDPKRAQLETVFVSATPLFGELESHNQRLRKAGLRIDGDGPQLAKVSALNLDSPVTLAVTVDHPERRLHDATGKLVGVRKPERRHGMLWLVQDPSGRYRIAEAVDLGAGEGSHPSHSERVSPASDVSKPSRSSDKASR